MKVAAIMPTYNQAEFIEEAVGSVVPQVDQLVIVNDGSTDGTYEYLNDPINYMKFTARLINVVHKDNEGTALAINDGMGYTLEAADWLTWVSSDNIYEPHWMETLKAAVEEDTAVVYSDFTMFWGDGSRKPQLAKRPEYSPTFMISGGCLPGASFIVRRDVWEEAGPHEGGCAHDLGHWLKIEEVCWHLGLKFKHVPISLCKYRMHDGQADKAFPERRDAQHVLAVARKRRGL